MIRADQERRRALVAIANLGASGRDGVERFRMVIYLTGDRSEHAADIERCKAFIKSKDWEVATVRTDPDASQWAWLRMGLLSAITMICHLQADGVVMPRGNGSGEVRAVYAGRSVSAKVTVQETFEKND